MNALLFNSRLLSSTDPRTVVSESKTLFSITTIFHPDSLICFEALLCNTENEDGTTSLQCLFIEETPQILDREFDCDILSDFQTLIDQKACKEIVIPPNIAQKIFDNALEVSAQLVTH
ncbi:MAG: hypothetical protein ABFQ53_02950 [Patescibacteria group bacterium]